jgi:hypothetical protein
MDGTNRGGAKRRPVARTLPGAWPMWKMESAGEGARDSRASMDGRRFRPAGRRTNTVTVKPNNRSTRSMNSRHNLLSFVAAGALTLLGSLSGTAQLSPPIGQWDFNAGNLNGTGTPALQYIDVTETQFGTTTELGIPNIGGAVANVMRFPASDAFNGYVMPVNTTPNGGGTLVNQWTIIMDVLWPTASASLLRGLIETDGRLIDPNADLFVNETGGFGVNGQFDGQINANTWYRIALVVNTPNNELRKYINGVLVGVQPATSGGTAALDGRWALDPATGAELFNDDNFESAVGYVNSIQLRDVALTPSHLQALGGPSAAGIPAEIPPIPVFVERWTPKGPFVNPTTPYGVVLNLGDNLVADSSIEVRLDGTLRSRTIDRDGLVVTIESANTGALPVGSEHTLAVSFVGNIDGPTTFTHTFRVAAFVEDFEGVTLGPKVDEGLPGEAVWTQVPPAGWTVDDSGVPGFEDPGTDGVTEWAGWGFADRDWWATTAGNQRRAEFLKASGVVAIADPDEWDDASHAPGMYNAYMSTPTISVAGLSANSLFLKFDSSWRPECCDDDAALPNDQSAVITVSYDGGAPIEVMRWSSDPANPNFHDDNSVNESITVQLNNPAGASSMVLKIGLITAENDWWWAIDNLVVSSGVLPPSITSQPDIVTATEGELATMTITAAGGAPLSYQWYFGSGAARTPLAGATGPTLNIPNVRVANAGIYTVQVSNPGGTADSGPISLVVLPSTVGSVTNEMVVHLKFDGDATDNSGRANNGTEVGTPSYVPGRVGQALRYSTARDGSSFNYVSLGQAADLEFGTSVNFSIAYWTRFTTWTGDPSFVSNKDWRSGGNPGYVLATAGDGALQWNVAPNRLDYDGAPGTLSDNQWHHVAFTWDRTGLITTYIDGVQVNNTPNGAVRDLTTGLPTNIGQDGTGTYTDGGGVGIEDGTIDDVGIWRRVLSEAEIKAIIRAALDGKDLSQATVAPPVGRDLVAYLPFDGNLTDATGRGNNGTSVGATPFVSGRLGQAVSYLSLANGSSFNYVSLGRPADLNFGTSQSFSVAFWAKLNTFQGDPAFIANKDWDSGNNPGWVVATAGDGRVQWNIAGTATGAAGERRDYDSGGGYFNNAAWRHVVVAFERLPGSGRARTYIDGRRINETTWAGVDNQLDSVAPRNTNIGQDGMGDYTDGNSVGVDGVMDELVIWRRSLIDDEVAGVYAAGVLGLPASGASPGLTLQLPPTGLQITKVGPGTLRLTWQANAGVVLQRSVELGAGAVWQDVPGTLTVGSYDTAPDSGTAFYRLRRR